MHYFTCRTLGNLCFIYFQNDKATLKVTEGLIDQLVGNSHSTYDYGNLKQGDGRSFFSRRQSVLINLLCSQNKSVSTPNMYDYASKNKHFKTLWEALVRAKGISHAARSVRSVTDPRSFGKKAVMDYLSSKST